MHATTQRLLLAPMLALMLALSACATTISSPPPSTSAAPPSGPASASGASDASADAGSPTAETAQSSDPGASTASGGSSAEATDGDSGVVLLVTGEFAPYTSAGLEGGGFFQKRVEQVLRKADIPYRIESYPWQRVMNMVENGEAWAGFPFGTSEVRTGRFDLTDSLFNSQFLYFYMADNPAFGPESANWKDPADFGDLVFGCASGYWYGTREDFDARGLKSEWAGDTDALVQMLYHGRIDVFMEDEAVGLYAFRQRYPDDTDRFSMLPNPAIDRDYGLLTSTAWPGAQRLVERFNAALAELKQDEAFLAALP